MTSKNTLPYIIFFFILIFSFEGISQTTTYYEIDKLAYLNTIGLGKIKGIKKVNGAKSGRITVFMYYKPYLSDNYDISVSRESNPDALIYGCFSDASSTDISHIQSYWYNTYTYSSTCSSKRNLNYEGTCTHVNFIPPTRINSTDYVNRFKNAVKFEDHSNRFVDIKGADIPIPVKIILKFENGATIEDFDEVKLPGVNVVKSDFMVPMVVVNGEKNFILNSGNANSTIFDNLKMGDELTFKIPKASVSSDKSKISIDNLPGVWVARFGWDLMYYRTQSVQPGDFKPFLAFDSEVHSVLFRRFKDYFPKVPVDASNPSGYKINVDDWVDNGDFFSWSYVIQSRMDKDKSINDEPQVVDWKVAKIAGETDPSTSQEFTATQRHDQRRGLNVSFINKWNNIWTDDGYLKGNFTQYDGFSFELGADTDEYQYLGQVSKLATGNIGTAKITALNENDDTWKILMANEQDPLKENYRDNLALSYMVTAFKRNRNFVYGKNLHIPNLYQGFEIQDKGIYIKRDQSPCTGDTDCYYKQVSNTKYEPVNASGQVTLNLNGAVYNLKVDAKVPMKEDNGFFGSIEGTQWPSNFEKDVPYTFKGLKDLPDEELKKFSMLFQYEDGNGFLKTTKYTLIDADEIIKAKTSGKWTKKFDIPGFGYHNVSVIYNRCASCDSVIVAGKELSDIKLRFLAVNTDNKNFDKSRGDGYTWYKQDYYNDYPYAVPKYGFYNSNKPNGGLKGPQYLRQYNFKERTRLYFTILDSDPHTFRPDGIEFYKSNRSKANRIPNDSLSSAVPSSSKFPNGYLTWNVRSVTVTDNGMIEGDMVHTSYGNMMDYQFDNTGYYSVEVVYRGTSSVKHLIQISELDYGSANDGLKKGEIKFYDLTPDQKSWLGITGNDLKIASIENVLSKYKYNIENASNVTEDKATYDRYNNYVDSYNWYVSNNGQSINNSSDYLYKLKDGYNSIEEKIGYKQNWFRHIATNYANDSDVVDLANVNFIERESKWSIPSDVITKLNDLTWQVFEPWNITLPWIATTTYHGYLIRANIKCYFNMNLIFNNDNGCFSGRTKSLNNGFSTNINSLSAEQYTTAQESYAFNLSDEYKAKEAFYHDLKNNRKIIIYPNNYNGKTIEVKQFKSNNFITSAIVDTSSSLCPVSLVSTPVTNGSSVLSWSYTNIRCNPASYFKVFSSNDENNSIAILPATARTFIIKGLDCKSQPNYFIKAYNVIGNSVKSNTIQLNYSTPTAPTNLKSPTQTVYTINLSWDPQNSCSGNLKYYIKYYKTAYSSIIAGHINTMETSFHVNGLDPYTQYTFEVQTIDENNENLKSETSFIRVYTKLFNAEASKIKAEVLSDSMEVYPNPVDGNILSISGKIYPSQTILYRIFDIIGREVISGFLDNNKIEVSNLTSGNYLLQLVVPEGTIRRKFIKK